ncbi:hypothetical protein THAOC_07903 [Thalassiosira oceanica]|uniref:Uncharacterized protein n=1 Tax=Thalassiosira oceanica TaxID=159749 RepID=K0TBE0_THAOC|nr:hypothetical protein THAOC_07903 [Thalassiosira oceanica]|eukprot:EJK70721.1 hypothetical protein THAOC_07903 [Thalassiosira oceanica]
MSHIPSWKDEITESRCLVQIRLDELASLQTAMARNLLFWNRRKTHLHRLPPRTTPASQPQPATPTAVRRCSDKGQQGFQRAFDTTEGDVLGEQRKMHWVERVARRTTTRTFKWVAPPADGTASHSHPEVQGDADIKGTAVGQAATTDGAVFTSYSMFEGDTTKCGGADVHSVPQEDNESDDDVQGLARVECIRLIRWRGRSERRGGLGRLPTYRSTATADADAEFTVSNIVPIGWTEEGRPSQRPPRQSNGRLSGRSKHKKKKGKHAVPASALLHQPRRQSSQQSELAPTAILPRSDVIATDGPRPPSFRQLWLPVTLTTQSSTKGGTRANRMTPANGDGQAMLELKRQLTRLLLMNSRLRQENSRLTSELADARLTVQVSPQEDREDTATIDDDNATVATSNLTDVDGCETVPDH